MKRAEILMRPRKQSVMKQSQGPRFMTGVSHLKEAECSLKICEDYTFCRENYGQRFLGLSRRLIHTFSAITTNHSSTELIVLTWS